MVPNGRRSSWWLGGLAGAGLLATHWLTYRIAVPDHHRAHVLDDTGHAYWTASSALVLALLTVASIRACGRALRGEPGARLPATVRRLVTVQAGLWVAVEVGERAAAGQLATLDDHPVLLLGLVVQLAVALVGAALVWLARRAVAALLPRRDDMPARRRPRSTARPVTADTRRRLVPLAGPHGLRGPPVTLPTS